MRGTTIGNMPLNFSFEDAVGFELKVGIPVQIYARDVDDMLRAFERDPDRFKAHLGQFHHRFPEHRVKASHLRSNLQLHAENRNLRTFIRVIAEMGKTSEIPDENNLETLASLIDGARQYMERNPE